MRTDISHLPLRNQRELERIVRIIFEEFEDEHKLATGDRKQARIVKIILYGSFGRGDWIYSPETNGFASDYDILIIVNREDVLDEIHWVNLKDHLSRDHGIAGHLRHEASIIVHTLQQVNNNLAEGRHFFVNLQNDAIALYQLDDSVLATPQPLTAEGSLALAQEYFEDWFPTAGEFFVMYDTAVREGFYKNAAFQLHQAAERLYHTLLLTCTLYTPHTHNLDYLRKIAKQIDRRLVYVWPEGQRMERARFNRLKDAYVKVRYSKRYQISREDLEWLSERVQELSQVVQMVCAARIDLLKQEAAKA